MSSHIFTCYVFKNIHFTFTLTSSSISQLLVVPMAYAVCGLKECTLLNGTVPVPVYNSHYKILENGIPSVVTQEPVMQE